MSEFNAEFVGKLSRDRRPEHIARLRHELTLAITEMAKGGGCWCRFEFRKWYWVQVFEDDLMDWLRGLGFRTESYVSEGGGFVVRWNLAAADAPLFESKPDSFTESTDIDQHGKDSKASSSGEGEHELRPGCDQAAQAQARDR